MRVEQMICPVCARPRAKHHPDCRYETTLQAAAERFSETLRDLGRALLKSLHLR